MEGKRTQDIGQKQIAATHPADAAGPFGNNRAGSFLYKKTERLAVALHLVTNAIPHEEAVRTRIREAAVALLWETLALWKGFRSVGPEKTNDIGARLLELISLLDVANAAGYLSRMNLSILRTECVRLVGFMRDVEDTTDAEAIVLAESYFKMAIEDYKGHQRDGVSGGGDSMSFKKASDAFKGHDIQKDRTRSTPRAMTGKKRSSKTDRSETRLARRERILSLVREKGRVSVKDIAAVIRDCGEKTLQRELLLLVGQGVLTKEGERRWSTYAPAQTRI